MGIGIDGVSHRFGSAEVLRDVSLDVAPGEFLTLLGPSGSGKTTLLRLIAGLLDTQVGRILIGGKDVSRLPAHRREIGFVFQNYALFPHMTVRENVGFPLRLRRMGAHDARGRVNEVLDLVSLRDFADQHPGRLSGGQQQRVALARAVVFEPVVLLMDEPLGALDKRLRRQLQRDMRDFQRKLKITAVYVTHDQEEAFTMSDRIAVMNHGAIQQVCAPIDLYRAPATEFVADFVGDLNTFAGTIVRRNGVGGVVRTGDGMEIAFAGAEIPGTSAVTCGVRPERVRVEGGPAPDRERGNSYRAVVAGVRFNGSRAVVDLTLGDGSRVMSEIAGADADGLRAGQHVWASWGAEDALVFPQVGAAAHSSGETEEESGRTPDEETARLVPPQV